MDVENDPGKGLVCAMEEWQKDNLLIIAAGYSTISTPIAMVGPTVGGLQMDWAGTSPALSDKARFGFYSRIIPPDDLVVMYMARLWEPLGVQLYRISIGGSSWGSRSRSSGARRGFKGERTHLSPLGPPKMLPRGSQARLLVVTWGYKRLILAYERGDYGLPLFQKFVEQLPVEVLSVR